MDLGRLDETAHAYGVELVVQFGSTVAGTARAGSDLDLAVRFAGAPPSDADQADLAAALQSLVPGVHVDLAVLNHADPLLLREVADHGRLLHGTATCWAEFRAYAFRRFQDHRRFLEMERAYLERAIAATRP